jgi:hypothetical protein
LFREGDPADALYIIARGEVDILGKSDAASHAQPISRSFFPHRRQVRCHGIGISDIADGQQRRSRFTPICRRPPHVIASSSRCRRLFSWSQRHTSRPVSRACAREGTHGG